MRYPINMSLCASSNSEVWTSEFQIVQLQRRSDAYIPLTVATQQILIVIMCRSLRYVTMFLLPKSINLHYTIIYSNESTIQYSALRSKYILISVNMRIILPYDLSRIAQLIVPSEYRSFISHDAHCALLPMKYSMPDSYSPHEQ